MVMPECFLNYTTEDKQITVSGEVELSTLCNGWVAINVGDTPVYVNGQLLNPALGPGLSGESRGVQGNRMELYKGRVVIAFQPPIGLNPLVLFTQKFYIANA